MHNVRRVLRATEQIEGNWTSERTECGGKLVGILCSGYLPLSFFESLRLHQFDGTCWNLLERRIAVATLFPKNRRFFALHEWSVNPGNFFSAVTMGRLERLAFVLEPLPECLQSVRRFLAGGVRLQFECGKCGSAQWGTWRVPDHGVIQRRCTECHRSFPIFDDYKYFRVNGQKFNSKHDYEIVTYQLPEG